WFSEFIDGGAPAPSPPPPGNCTAAANDFVATWRIHASAFPLQPWCDECRPLGVRDGQGQLAQFVVRWANGFDARAPGDTAHQWIEERSAYAARPYLRIEGTGTTLRLSSSTDGVSYR